MNFEYKGGKKVKITFSSNNPDIYFIKFPQLTVYHIRTLALFWLLNPQQNYI